MNVSMSKGVHKYKIDFWAFMGTNPAIVRETKFKGKEVLRKEQAAENGEGGEEVRKLFYGTVSWLFPQSSLRHLLSTHLEWQKFEFC